MDMLDTTTATGKGLMNVYKNTDHLRFSTYIQPQYQIASAKGIKSFEGGNFSPEVSNRFMLRRSRVRLDFVHYARQEKGPDVQFVFQFDANERSFTVRDVWGRIFENKYKLFSFTTGMFARPFGYEINLSSSDRETPERGRMSQTLMKSERDLGAMVSLDSRADNKVLKSIKIDAGIFNGQGINAEGDFDNAKDFIGRIALRPKKLSPAVTLAAGTSILYGGLQNNTRYRYTTNTVGGIKQQLVDSSGGVQGSTSPRRYYGADVQLKIKNKAGFTELRGEVIAGQQTGLATSTDTPLELLSGTDGFYARRFNGAYFYLLQNIFNDKNQLVVKYDWYDPNGKVKGEEIGAPGSNFTDADIKYSTLGLGYVNYITPNVKAMLYYAMVRNEKTQLPGFTSDVDDNVFTARIQFRF
ncbi:MAG: porin [Chitinophagaceae bacterium]|nr:MAG: porin [Chitinophagaceae bacterium]